MPRDLCQAISCTITNILSAFTVSYPLTRQTCDDVCLLHGVIAS